MDFLGESQGFVRGNIIIGKRFQHRAIMQIIELQMLGKANLNPALGWH